MQRFSSHLHETIYCNSIINLIIRWWIASSAIEMFVSSDLVLIYFHNLLWMSKLMGDVHQNIEFIFLFWTNVIQIIIWIPDWAKREWWVWSVAFGFICNKFDIQYAQLVILTNFVINSFVFVSLNTLHDEHMHFVWFWFRINIWNIIFLNTPSEYWFDFVYMHENGIFNKQSVHLAHNFYKYTSSMLYLYMNQFVWFMFI